MISQQAFSNCDFKIKEGQYFTKSSGYGIKISFPNACSGNSFYKRQLFNPDFSLYKNGKLITKLNFKEGYWLESSKKFYLKGALNSDKECGVKNLTLNLNNGYLTSLQGAYLNLKESDAKRWTCGI